MSISSNDFEFVSKLVREEAAIVLEKGKEYLVESRLSPVAKRSGFETIEQLIQELRTKRETSLVRKVTEALTTNETSFFRDVEPFEALKTTVLPQLIAARREARSLNIWCAASSTGQEPYSLAMLLRENFPELKDWSVTFVATDISRDVLERARSGLFTQMEVNRGLPVTYLVKYFTKHGADWQIKDEIRKMVRFEELNLVKPLTLVSNIDLVMIRNVLIYFDINTKKEILGKIKKIMRQPSFMFLGAAETTLNLDEGFERRAVGKTSCYQKKT